MHRLHPRYVRSAEGADGGGGDPAAKQDSAPAKGEFDKRPEWLPEQFYDPETKGPRIKEMAKGYLDMRTKVAKGVETYKSEYETQRAAEIAKVRPVEPTGYKLELDAEKYPSLVLLEAPPGQDFKPEPGKQYAVVDPKDPMLEWWRSTAHAQGLSHAQYSEGIAGFLQAQISKQPNYEKELEKLGEGGTERIKEVDTWMRGNLNEATYKTFEKFAQTAEGLEAIEGLISSAGGPKLGKKPGAAADPEAPTAKSVREMIKDPRYWDQRRRDPAYIREVEAAYAQAFPGSRGIAPTDRTSRQ